MREWFWLLPAYGRGVLLLESHPSFSLHSLPCGCDGFSVFTYSLHVRKGDAALDCVRR